MNTAVLALTYFFVDIAGGLIRWPLWWYTKGIALVASWAATSVKRAYTNIALKVWVKNLFVPMYGLRDWQGRMVSFLVRLVQIVFRSLVLLFWVVAVALVMVLYLLLLPFAVVVLLYHAGAAFV